jgi:hypothetical protein
MDSFSGRLSANPMRDVSLQVSYGFLKSPEHLEPGVSVHRVTASVTYNRPPAADGIGQPRRHGAATYLCAENRPTACRWRALDLDGTKVFFGRSEYVREMGQQHDVQAPRPDPVKPDPE